MEILRQKLVNFLDNQLKNSHRKTFILGLSGGLDSAVVLALCSLVKNSNTKAFILPTNSSNSKNLDDALEVANKFKVPTKIINISPIIKAYDENLPPFRLGNLAARVRMSVLYDKSEEFGGVVVGTGNLSERLLGYSTIYGDLACAFNPIGEIFKSELFDFAKFLGIPKSIIDKAPSADLVPNQTDEADLGYSYEVLDSVLKAWYDDGFSFGELKDKFEPNLLNLVENRVKKNSFKLQMPPIAMIRSNSARNSVF